LREDWFLANTRNDDNRLLAGGAIRRSSGYDCPS
jgi:hypothetical protein